MPETAGWNYVNRLAMSADGTRLLAAVRVVGFNANGAPNGDNPGLSGIYESTDSGATFGAAPVQTGVFGDIDFQPGSSDLAVAGVTSSGGVAIGDSYWIDYGGAATWTAATGLPAANVRRVELAWSNDGSGRLYASVAVNAFQFNPPAPGNSSTGGVYRSDNNGQTFTPVNRAPGMPGGLIGDGTDLLSGQGVYDNIIWVSPVTAAGAAPADATEDVILVGGVDLWRSTDGGANFTQIARWQVQPDNGGNSMHADHHAIQHAPDFDGTAGGGDVYFGNDGGMYRSNVPLTTTLSAPGPDNPAGDWVRINNANLGITQFYGCDAQGTINNEILAGGTQDNGTPFFAGSGAAPVDADWPADYVTGDGGTPAIDVSTATAAGGGWIYGSYFSGDLWRRQITSTGAFAATENQQLDGQGWPPTQQRTGGFAIPEAGTNAAPFITRAMELDPQVPTTLYVGFSSLWRTNDAQTAIVDPDGAGPMGTGPTWASAKVPVPGAFVSAVKVDPNNSNSVWVAYDNGQVWWTSNGTNAAPTWNRVGGVAGVANLIDPKTGAAAGTANWPTRVATGIAIDPNDGNHVCVSFGGYVGGNLWRTRDGGATWTIGSNMPQIPMYDVEINPTRSDTLYMASEVGVIASVDGGRFWSASDPGTNEGPANVRVMDLFWLGNTLYAGTHGRGVWRQTTGDAGPPTLTTTLARRVLDSANTRYVSCGAKRGCSGSIRCANGRVLHLGYRSQRSSICGSSAVDARLRRRWSRSTAFSRTSRGACGAIRALAHDTGCACVWSPVPRVRARNGYVR